MRDGGTELEHTLLIAHFGQLRLVRRRRVIEVLITAPTARDERGESASSHICEPVADDATWTIGNKPRTNTDENGRERGKGDKEIKGN